MRECLTVNTPITYSIVANKSVALRKSADAVERKAQTVNKRWKNTADCQMRIAQEGHKIISSDIRFRFSVRSFSMERRGGLTALNPRFAT